MSRPVKYAKIISVKGDAMTMALRLRANFSYRLTEHRGPINR
jgi:hypothetical protein